MGRGWLDSVLMDRKYSGVESTALIKVTRSTRNAVVSKSDHDGGVCWDDSAVAGLSVVDRSWNGIDKS
jgi:ribosome biogenesis protein Tsr3